MDLDCTQWALQWFGIWYGALECWRNGTMCYNVEKECFEVSLPILHYSITPDENLL